MGTRVRPGLGRGLGALIPTSPEDEASRLSSGTSTADGHGGIDPAVAVDLRDHPPLSAVPGMALRDVSVSDIVPNPRQPRTEFDPDALAELSASLREVGFLQPIVVRRSGEGFELVAGERRLRAAAEAGFTAVPALVRDTPDDALLRDALLENLHRVQLNALEEAAAYQQLLEDFGCTQEELANRLGKSRPAVTNSLRLLRLPATVQRRVAAGVLSAGHARALVALDSPDQAEVLANRVVVEGMSVRALEEAIALGESDDPSQRRKRRSPRPSPHAHVADDLADRLDTRVKVTGTASRGKISIEFGSADDLGRILTALKDPTTWA